MPNYVFRPIRHPRLERGEVGEVRVDLEVENGTNRNVDPTFLFDVYAHLAPFGHPIHNAADDRQTERSEQAAYGIASAAQ